MASQPLAGKTALVTGSSRGIGAAIAHRLVEDGANVIVNYVNNAKAAKAVSLNAFGRLDILVLNAGIMGTKTLDELDEEFYDAHFNVNVKGPLFLVKAAAPYLQPGSRVVFFSSTLAHASVVPSTALVYAAAKGAVEQLVRVLAKDLGTRRITVNSIAPGPIDTELFRQGKSEQQIGFFLNMHPEKRLGEPEEVARVVAFLASPDSSWINGQTILVNGGYVV
ncbi:NAD-binding protein [Phellopilus nigrolimitatus]|nr:NAD-binding protein [Phellopilus nigrolimitatus]